MYYIKENMRETRNAMLRFLDTLQFVLFVFFTAAYAYQIVYLVIGLVGKGRHGKQDARLHRYAAVIAARNEEGVIGELIRDLKAQNYPAGLLDVFVVADNCTDGTAAVSRAMPHMLRQSGRLASTSKSITSSPRPNTSFNFRAITARE